MAKRRKPAKGSFGLAVPVIMAIVLFFVMCFAYSDTVKVTAIILMALTLVVGAIRFGVLRDSIQLPLILLMAITAMGCISAFYAAAGKFALEESLALMVALCSTLLLLCVFNEKDMSRARKIGTVLEFAAALSAIFSIDLISTRFLSDPLLSFLEQYSGVYRNLPGVEVGSRMLSIFNTPNAYAGVAGIGVLLGLSLTLSAVGRKERRFHLCCLYANSVGFVLAFSMGATASIALAFVVYLLIESKERRGELLLLMVKTLILAAVAMALCSATAFDKWDGIQPVPLLSLIAGAVLLCLADRYVGRSLGEKLRDKSKLIFICIAALIVLALVFALVAYNVTGAVDMAAGEALRRAAYPEPGEYTLAVEGGYGVNVVVTSQNRQDTMMHTNTVIYNGPVADAVFVVPEDSLVVYFDFAATGNTTLESVEYIGTADTGRVPLNYPLLPDFISNRLQGLFANQNAIQRTIFFEDGIKLFKTSPIWGLGVGAFENASQSVQSFYYETKYVHNHYIQTLLETGIIGFILFVGIMVVSAIAVWRCRRKENFHPMTPALGALLVFMAVHAGVEVVFSVYYYLPIAFGVFALINICCADGFPVPSMGKKLRSGVCIACGVLVVVCGVFLLCNMEARRIAETGGDYDSFKKAATLDVYEWTDYALTYVLSASKNDVEPEVMEQAEKYVRRIERKEISNIAYLYLTEYCLNLGDVPRAMEMAEKHVRCVAPENESWNALLALLEQFEEDSEEFRAGIQRLMDFKDTWNSENIGNIQLNDTAQAFVDRVLTE